MVLLQCTCDIQCFLLQFDETDPNLENTCNQSLTIECPYTYTGRAGTFRYYFIPDLPTGLCYFNVTLASNCGRSWDFFAFYFNIRKFVLPTADYVRIYGTDRLAARILLKELTGSYTAWSNPSSVSQALTSYAKQPSFTFEYFRSTFASTGVHEAYIDFVVVEDSSHSMNTRCTALSGYVNNNFICHTDGANDRVNCPASFNPVVYGMNPVYTRQSCIAQPTSPYYSYTSTPSYWNSHGLIGKNECGILCAEYRTEVRGSVLQTGIPEKHQFKRDCRLNQFGGQN
ncbi:uncharacterized protein LOC129596463 isoform X2 [Paramacrobiotus metropolitanus]|uniref:uncharacterized protein LOC129596463 isoform X2 n=1 Tax=Paramacrobiotus metropolitanus TaxID=2943436 RepID=UPI002445C837|nr:uncharacterized protein LOC129596463 isoform X2 [Paramacrobiotus metropolitanus]